MAYDSVLLIGVLSAGFMLPHLALNMVREANLPGWVLWAHLVALLGLYFVWCWDHGGQTLAMQTWKIHLSTPGGTPPSVARLTLRYVLAWPSLLCLGIGVLWAMFDRDRQFLHDRVAGTRIVFRHD
jgi:uncharacterized RDD family membrane protein YckC